MWSAGLNRLAYKIISGLTVVVAPFVVISVLYTRVLLDVRRSARRLMDSSSTPTASSLLSRRLGSEWKLPLHLVLSVTMFGLLYLPYFVFTVAVVLKVRTWPSLYPLVTLLTISYTRVNPALIVCFSEDYRRLLARFLPCGFGVRLSPSDTAIMDRT